MNERITEALAGKNGADQQRIAEVGLEWLDLLLRKNRDYGSAVWQSPILAPDMLPGDAIRVRMSDKVQRIISLAGRPPEVSGESIRDTFSDLGSYCLLFLARPPEPAKELLLRDGN